MGFQEIFPGNWPGVWPAGTISFSTTLTNLRLEAEGASYSKGHDIRRLAWLPFYTQGPFPGSGLPKKWAWRLKVGTNFLLRDKGGNLVNAETCERLQ